MSQNLDSFELRRLRVDLIWCYKIIFGPVYLNVNNFLCLKLLEDTHSNCLKHIALASMLLLSASV